MYVVSLIIKVFAIFSYHVSLHTSFLLAILHYGKILSYLMENYMKKLTNYSWPVVRSMCFIYAENILVMLDRL